MKLHFTLKSLKFISIVALSIVISFFHNIELNAQTILASDEASNYTTWSNSSNNGTGFGSWLFTSSSSSGMFIGNPTNDGMETTGIGSTAFGMYSTGTTSYAHAHRPFVNALAIGDQLSFYWVINWNSKDGNKGIDFKSGPTTIFNINHAKSDNLSTSTGETIFQNYGTTPMLIKVLRISETEYLFSLTRRHQAGGTYYTTFTSNNALNGITFYT